MGISAGGGGPGGIKSDINVTPLVDIVLVLLIIFLVTMPVQMRQITIEVPREIDDTVEVVPSTQITVTLKTSGLVEITDGKHSEEVPRVQLAKTLRPMVEAKRTEKVVFVDFEDEVAYGEAVSVMDTVKQVGVPPDGKKDASEVKVALKIRKDMPTQ